MSEKRKYFKSGEKIEKKKKSSGKNEFKHSFQFIGSFFLVYSDKIILMLLTEIRIE